MHIFEESTLNSASAEHAELYSVFGLEQGGTRHVPAIDLERLCALHRLESLDVLCLDIEGLDLAVLERADLSRIRPKLICVEAVRYLSDKTPVVEPRFAEVLQAKGYVKYADTFINQIYADEAHYARLKLL